MALSMSQAGRSTQRLTRRAIVLLPQRVRIGLASGVGLLIAAQLAAAAAAWWYWQQRQASVDAQERAHQHAESDTQRQVGALQREVEQARLQQRLSAARSQELERQIDTLNRQLRDSQEELGFLRQARATRR